MIKIAVLASFNMDLVMRTERRPEPGETLQGEFDMYLGGKGFNQAIAARRLGATVEVVGRVGADEFGRRFLHALDDEGIDRAGVIVDQERGTGVASIVVSADGENAIIQAPRANRAVTADQLAARQWLFDDTAVAMLQLETSMAAATEFARRARAAGALTFLNPAPAAPVPAELLQLTDVLVPNEIEARTLTGMAGEAIDGALAMGEALCAQGPRRVVITLGALGAVAVANGLRVHVPAFRTPVVDTVGAGDAFCAALAMGLGEGAALEQAVRFACAAGAIACTRAGAEPSMPRREEVDALAARGVHA